MKGNQTSAFIYSEDVWMPWKYVEKLYSTLNKFKNGVLRQIRTGMLYGFNLSYKQSVTIHEYNLKYWAVTSQKMKL